MPGIFPPHFNSVFNVLHNDMKSEFYCSDTYLNVSQRTHTHIRKYLTWIAVYCARTMTVLPKIPFKCMWWNGERHHNKYAHQFHIASWNSTSITLLWLEIMHGFGCEDELRKRKWFRFRALLLLFWILMYYISVVILPVMFVVFFFIFYSLFLDLFVFHEKIEEIIQAFSVR